MRIVIDECVHAGVKQAFSGHAVRTVTEAGWSSSKDGPLLEFAQKHFDVFDNRIQSYQGIFGELKAAAEQVKPGELVIVINPLLRGARPR